jgi:hypothetical protein
MNRKNTTNMLSWKQNIFILLVLLFGSINLALAQDSKIDISSLVNETQKQNTSNDKMELVWWIPEEFWRASFEKDPDFSVKKIEAFLKILRPYTLVLGVDGVMGEMGGITYATQESIQSNIQIVDAEGTHYRPLNDDKIDADTKNFLAMMKPILANMLGPMGQNMHFFLFPSTDKKGSAIANAKSEGTFTVLLDKSEYKWRLPLGSVFPPKTCPVDGEKLSGAWKYCPWHGVELK